VIFGIVKIGIVEVKKTTLSVLACISISLLGASAQVQQANMSFFVTSVGPGKGADLSGLAGADQHCQRLAAAVGVGSKIWRAYLSTQGSGAVDARDGVEL
jgi:hypothetical protein